MSEKKGKEEQEFKVSGSDLLSTVKELVHQGNVRHIIIKNEKGRTLVEIPLTMGILGVALIPVYAAVGAIAALVVRCTIVVRNTDRPDTE